MYVCVCVRVPFGFLIGTFILSQNELCVCVCVPFGFLIGTVILSQHELCVCVCVPFGFLIGTFILSQHELCVCVCVYPSVFSLERSSDKPELSVAGAQICVTPSGENLFDKLNPVTRSALLASRIFLF